MPVQTDTWRFGINMRLAKIDDLIVTNIIIGEAVDFPTYTDVTSTRCGIGWTDNQNGTFTDNRSDEIPVTTESLKEYLTVPITDELVDVALNDNSASNRKDARDINKRLDSKKPLDAMGQELDDILTEIVSLTSLTNPDKTNILDALQDV